MQATQKKYGKPGGVLGYHFIQSFKPGELTPEQTHEIGLEFAQRLFGDRFEVVIGTHLNKQHLHNHIVVNSVSFKDGKKYRSNVESYYKEVRAVSDRLCEEYGLSVITPRGRSKHYMEWQAEKEGRPTVRGQLRHDIDGLISQSLNFITFLELLKKSGYSVKYGNVKHTAIKPPYSQRYIRLDSLGENYAAAAIEARILRQKSWRHKRLTEPVKHFRYKGSFEQAKKVRGFRALYFRYVYLLRGAAKGTDNKKVSRYLLEDTLKFERYVAQHKFLMQGKIETSNDLQEVKTDLQEQLDVAITARQPLYDERRVSVDELKTKGLSRQITASTSHIKALRHDLRLCEQIDDNIKHIKERAKEAQKLQRQENRKAVDKEQVHRRK